MSGKTWIFISWIWLAAQPLGLAALASAAHGAARVIATYSLGQNEFGLSNPHHIAFDPVRKELWITGSGADFSSGRIVVVDAVSKKPVAVISDFPSYYYGQALGLDPQRGRAYAVYGNMVSVFDTASRKLLKSVSLDSQWISDLTVDPGGPTLGPGGDLYILGYGWDPVSAQYVQTISRRDCETLVLKSSVSMGSGQYYFGSWGIEVKGSKLYLPIQKWNYATWTSEGEIWVLDKQTLQIVQKLSLGAFSWPTRLAVDSQSGTVYVGDLAGKIWVLKPDVWGQLAHSGSIPAHGPWVIALDTATHRIYSSNFYLNSVDIVDTVSSTQIATLAAGHGPSFIAMDHGQGKAFVLNYWSSDVSVYDLKTDTLESTISVRLETPYDIALDPGSNRTLVTSGSGGIIYWDRGIGAVERFIAAPWGAPANIVLFPELKKAFFKSTNFCGGSYLRKLDLSRDAISWAAIWWSIGGISAREGFSQLLVTQRHNPSPPYDKGRLSVFDAAGETSLKDITLGPSEHYPKGVAANVLTDKAYVVLFATHQVAVADLKHGQGHQNIPVGYYPEAVAVNSILNKVYVSNYGSNSVSVIDGSSQQVIATIPVGKMPRGIAVMKKGHRVYVANSGEDTVTVIDGLSDQILASLPVGRSPQNVRVDEAKERIYVSNWAGASITVIEDPSGPDSSPPYIAHTPILGPQPEAQALSVRAEVRDDMAVAMVTLTYWDTATTNYITVPMNNVSGSLYEAVISTQFFISMQGAETAYFIDAADYQGNSPVGLTPGTPSSPNRFQVNKTLVKLWNYEFGQVYGGFYRMIPGPSAAVADIRPDLPGLEIATGNEEYYPLGYPGPAGRWFLFNPQGGVVFWKDTENDEAHSSVNLADLNGDGSLEMLGGTTSGNELQAWDRQGQWTWRYILGSHHIATPAVDSLSEGGPISVFGGSFDAYVRSIDGKTGALNWAFKAASWIWSSPAVADLDADGFKEVVVGSDYDGFYALDATSGKLKWTASLGGHIRASPALADLDDDGILEVLIGSPNGRFYALEGATGKPRWTFAAQGGIISSPAVGDLDGDGRAEIVFGSEDGHLYALSSAGALRWKVPLASPIHSSPALARRGAKPGLDVYITTLDGRLVLIEGATGQVLAGFQVKAGIVSSPIVADIDGDGKLEVFFQDRKGDLDWMMTGDRFWAVRDMESSVAPYAREWPMFRRDPAHTGVYPLPNPPPVQVQGLSVSAPPEGARLRLQWMANAEPDIAAYKVYRNGNFLVRLATTSYLDAGLTDGTTYTHQVSAVDLAGQEGLRSDPVSTVPRDLAPPVSNISLTGTAGANGYFVSTVTAAITAEDTGSGVAQTLLRLDGTLWQNYISSIPIGTGLHSLEFYSADKEANVEAIHSQKISVDTSPPVTQIGLQGARQSNGYFMAIATAALIAHDDLSGADKTYWRLDGGSWQVYISSIPITVGIHNLEFYSVDRAGTAEVVKSTIVKVGQKWYADDNNWGPRQDGSQTCPFSSIQQALNISLPGDMVWVYSGLYPGRVDISTERTVFFDGDNAVTDMPLSLDGISLEEKQYPDCGSWDGDNPVVGILIPSASSTSLALAGTASDPTSGVRTVEIALQDVSNNFFWNGYDAWTATKSWLVAAGTQAWSLIYPSFALTTGHGYQVYARATDLVGNNSISSITFNWDMSPPVTSVSLQGTPEGSGYFISFVTATLSASHSGSGIDKTYWRLGGGAWRVYATPFLVQDGIHMLEFYSINKLGISETLQSQKIPVDTLPPSGKLVINNGAVWTGTAAVTLSITAQDATSGMDAGALMSFSNDGVHWSTAEPFTTTKVWDLVAGAGGVAGEGQKTVYLKLRDAAGNWSLSPSSAQCAVDMSAPITQVQIPGATTSSSSTAYITQQGQVTLIADDSMSGVAQTFYRINAGAWTLYDGSFTVPDGQYVLECYSVNLAGTPENIQIINLTVDSQPPVGSVQVQSVSQNQAALILNAQDGVSGIDQICWSLDGVNCSNWTPYSSAVTVTLQQVEGPQTVYVHCKDKAGNMGLCGMSASIFLDLYPPSLAILKPQSGQIVTDILQVNGTAYDSGSGVAFVEIEVVNTSQTVLDWTVVKGTAAWSWQGNTPFANGQSYVLKARALDFAGRMSDSAQVSFTWLLKGKARAAIRTPRPGKRLRGNAVTVMAEADKLTSAVLFQFRSDSSQAWKTLSSLDQKKPYGVYWNLSALSNGRYWLRALAYDADGIEDHDPPQIEVFIDDANADIVEDGNPEVDPNVEHRKIERLSGDETEEVLVLDGTKVSVPPGALPKGESVKVETVFAQHAPQASASPAMSLKSVGVYRKIHINAPKLVNISITLPIEDEDQNGLVDGTGTPVEKLRIYYYSEAKAKWLPMSSWQGAISVQSAAGVAAASIPAAFDPPVLLGLFQEQTVPTALQLGEVYAFPNPARKGYHPTLHIETEIADRLVIRIYDLAGALVHSTAINGPPTISAGRYSYRYQWSTSGVAPGIYLYVAQVYKSGQDVLNARGKVALIR